MKNLELTRMENLQAGGFVDGACAVIGLSASGLAVRSVAARAGASVFFAIPLWGQVALAAGVVGCTAYNLSK